MKSIAILALFMGCLCLLMMLHHSQALSISARHIDPSVEKSYLCKSPYPLMFKTEVKVMESLKKTRYYVENDSLADFIFVQAHPYLYMACHHQPSDGGFSKSIFYAANVYNHAIVPWLSRTDPIWNQSNGSRYIFSFGFGASNDVLKNAHSIHNSILLSVTGDSGNSIWKRLTLGHKIITIPAFVDPMVNLSLSFRRFTEKATANMSLALFRGLIIRQQPQYSFGIRQFLIGWTENNTGSPLNVLEGNVPQKQFLSEVLNTKFGLCLPGYYWFTPRAVEYSAAGVVPVFIGDQLIPPFPNFINWSLFSIQVPKNTIMNPTELISILRSHTLDDLERMRSIISDYRHFMIWEVNGGRAWDALILELTLLTSNRVKDQSTSLSDIMKMLGTEWKPGRVEAILRSGRKGKPSIS